MDIIITIKNVKRGNARLRNGQYHITIPQWAIDRSDEYGTYYLCHELAHITSRELFGYFNHDEEFKIVEDAYLADFGLVVKRKKAYPRTLIAFGKIIDQLS